jgi:hypothetical protein
MNASLARLTIGILRAKPLHEADRALCEMHTDDLHAIAAELGMRLPLFGGDKPAMIIGGLRTSKPTGAV